MFTRLFAVMKTILFFLLAILVLCSSASHASGKYILDEERLEQAFELSEDVTGQFTSPFEINPFIANAKVDSDGLDKQTIAAIVVYAQFAVGIGFLIPIHRIILGCDDKLVKVIALYCVTFGGCGVISALDGLFLILDDTHEKYLENPNFIMWSFDDL